MKKDKEAVMIKAAVVILNWNGKKYLEKFLPSVIKNSDGEGYRIFIADNGSDDGSVNFLSENFPEVSIIKLEKNYGYALGYVKALDQIKAEYFILLNSDVEVTPGWISPLINMMDKNLSIAACMPKIRSYSNKNLFEYAGAAGGYIDSLGYPFCRGRILDTIEEDHNQYDGIHEIFWASGACMFVRASAYYQAGGLDGDFFAHMEEIDLCWRLKKAGYLILSNSDVTVYHVGGGTLPNNTPRKIYFNYRNSLFLLFKNLPNSALLPKLLIRVVLDITSSFVYLINLNPGFTWAVIKAHFAFYCNIPSLIKKRYKLQKISKNEYVSQIYRNSILVEYFFKKKKEFSSLNSK